MDTQFNNYTGRNRSPVSPATRPSGNGPRPLGCLPRKDCLRRGELLSRCSRWLFLCPPHGGRLNRVADRLPELVPGWRIGQMGLGATSGRLGRFNTSSTMLPFRFQRRTSTHHRSVRVLYRRKEDRQVRLAVPYLHRFVVVSLLRTAFLRQWRRTGDASRSHR